MPPGTAWTDPRDWVAGELVTEAIMDTHIRDNLNALGPSLMLMKTADQTVNNSATLVNDTHMVFAIGANQVWQFSLFLYVTSSTAADFKMGWSVPAGTTMRWAMPQFGSVIDWVRDASGSGTYNSLLTEASSLSLAGVSAGPQGFAAFGIITSSGTTGNVNFQWAQGTATAVDTKVTKGSNLQVRRGV